MKLRNPIYSETAAYGHMGRKPETVTKTFPAPRGIEKTVTVALFTWEKLDFVDEVKAVFGLQSSPPAPLHTNDSELAKQWRGGQSTQLKTLTK